MAMTDIDALFIERQARFQLGKQAWFDGSPTDLFQREYPRRSSIFSLYDPHTNNLHYTPKYKGTSCYLDDKGVWVQPDKQKSGKAYRNSDVLNSLSELGLAHPLFIDMQDGVSNMTSLHSTLQYNRVFSATNSMLWPLRGFHDIGDERFVGSKIHDEIPFEKKQPKIYWRGAFAGHSDCEGVRKNIIFLVREYLDREISHETFMAHLITIPRYKFMLAYFDNPICDVGFVIPKHQSHFMEIPDISRFVKPFGSRVEQFNYKYLLALSGNDVATSFPWQSESNSIVIRENYAWRAFYDCHFAKWVHYLPMDTNFSDLVSVYRWAEANESSCLQIIRSSQAVCRQLSNPSLRRLALKRMIDLFNIIQQSKIKATSP